jgi:hypothetical protein
MGVLLFETLASEGRWLVCMAMEGGKPLFLVGAEWTEEATLFRLIDFAHS